MKSTFVITISILTMLFVVNSAFALRPSKTPAAQQVMAEATKLLEKRDYQRLEKLLEMSLKNADRIDDGQWKFHIAMDGITGTAASSNNNSSTLEKYYALVADWSTKRPESKMAKVTLANSMVTRAFFYRGKDVASKTLPQQFTSFEKELERAYSVLSKINVADNTNPELYLAWLGFALGTGASNKDTDAIYVKAKSQFPDYYYITLQYLTSKFDRWNDDPDALKKALKPLNSNPELLARALWHFEVYDDDRGRRAATNGKADKEGYALIKKKYNSPITTNQIAYLACGIWHDKALFDKTIVEIKNNPDLNVWGDRNYYNLCINTVMKK